MLGSLLLNDKLTPIKLPKFCLPREKLIGVFNQLNDKRVIYVSAPAGYGKTVSTMLWLAGTERKVAWMALDHYDNSPSIFYKLLCMAILSVQPENKAIAQTMGSASFANSPVEHTIKLLSEFTPGKGVYALVLDDMHHIKNKELLKSWLLVRKRLPLTFITLILTRNEINSEFLSELSEDMYGVIAAEELSFSTEEIRNFFAVNGRWITVQEAAAVYSVTEGWPIGVNALTMSGADGLVERGAHLLENYIKEQIWDKWDENLRDFMMKTAMTDEMPVPLCEYITGREDSRRVLEILCETNPFVNRVSENTYRYHHLFLEFLRGLSEAGGIDVKEIYRLATYYYIGNGEFFLARRYATKSSDPNALMNVMHQLFEYESASLSEFVSFSELYETPPETVCDKAPALYGSLAWENYLLGNAAKMEYYLDKLYEFLPVIKKDFPQNLETTMMEISLDHRLSMSELIDRFADYLTIDGMYDNPRGATLTHEMPFLHRGSRDYYELVDDGLRERIKLTFGRLFKNHLEVGLAVLESGLYLEKDMRPEALCAAIKAKGYENEKTSAEIRFSTFVHLGAAYYALRDSKYKEILAETESFVGKDDAHHLYPNYAALKAKIQLLDGDKKAAVDWFSNYFVNDSETMETYKIYQYFTTARAYILLNQADKAFKCVSGIKALAADFNRLLDKAEAGVLQAVLEWAAGRKKEAQDTLGEVLLDLQPYGFIRVAAIEGAAILPVLRRLDANAKSEGYTGPLLAAYVHKVTLAAYEQSKFHKGIAVYLRDKPIKLSRRQKQILSLLAEGYTYKEIMNKTGLTIHTVKSHASAAYNKLGVHNSLDAAVKAREKGIID